MKRALWNLLGVVFICDQLLWVNSTTVQFGLRPEYYPFPIGDGITFQNIAFTIAFSVLILFALKLMRDGPDYISWKTLAFATLIVAGMTWIPASWYLGAPNIYDLLPPGAAKRLAKFVIDAAG